MNEYAYYWKDHTIDSSGQIEWNKYQVDYRSVQVGGSQCITTLDGYSFPLKFTGGLMYLSIMEKPTDDALVKYPSLHLTSIHKWDPSVLDYSLLILTLIRLLAHFIVHICLVPYQFLLVLVKDHIGCVLGENVCFIFF